LDLPACAAPRTQRILTESPSPHFGEIFACCEVNDSAFTVRAHATCVVDSNQRIVVTDFDDDTTILDTDATKQRLPNLPIRGVEVIALSCPNCTALKERKHHLLVTLAGDCADEHAAGSAECSTGPSCSQN
jgi:hypothetical protein